MGLLKKKKNEEETAAEVVQEEKSNPDEIKVKKTDEKFSGRTAAIFAKMYRMIISVSLGANACQIEAGERNLCGDVLPQTMYYSAFIDYLSQHMHPDDRDDFAKIFSAKNLSEALNSGECGICRVFMLEDSKPQEAEGEAEGEDDIIGRECSFYEFRADLIPDDGPVQSRCIIFIRKVLERDAEFSKSDVTETLTTRDNIDWSGIRVNRFLAGSNATLFEYMVSEDIMYIHGVKESEKTTIVKNYIKNMDARSDWSVYHGDLMVLKDALNDALSGQVVNVELRYRPLFDKELGFRYHRLSVSPADNNDPPVWLVGILADIDTQLTKEKISNEMADHIDLLLTRQSTEMFEIDMDKDLIFRIKKGRDGFERLPDPQTLSSVIKGGILSGLIHPESASEYDKWLKKGHLNRETLAKTYDFDSRLRLPGSNDYHWFSEHIERLEQGQRFIRFRTDIEEVQGMRLRDIAYQEKYKFSDYSGKMLDIFASVCETRKPKSDHAGHVSTITRMLLEDLSEAYPILGISKEDIELYAEASIVHDIGMLTVSDPKDLEAMKKHTTVGAQIFDNLVIPGQEDILEISKDVALHHHERYDGSGYPDKLVGDANKIGVQVIGLADIFDRMACESSVLPTDVLTGIMNGKYGAFNPKLLESLQNCQKRILKMYTSEDI